MRINCWKNILSGKSENAGVYMGSSGQLYEASQAASQIAEEKTTEAINNFANRYSDLNYYVLIIPDAATIQKSNLPPFAPTKDQAKEIEIF